ncbi:MAG: hypothetical protein AB9903_06460 [Vulcanimicrobiota bacterium]
MFCIQCGKKIGSSDRFCCFCGAEIPGNVASLQYGSRPDTVQALPCHQTQSQELSSGSPGHQSYQDEPERLLLTFGPLGFSIGKGSAELFSWEYRNLTRFEITTRRFRTVHQSALLFSIRRTLELDIPMEAIVSTERYSRSFIAFGLMGVLGIKYHTREGVAEINVTGDKGTLDKAHSLLISLRQRS